MLFLGAGLHLRESGCYAIRIRVPKDLQGALGKREIKRSLKTKRLSEARRLARAWLCKFDSIFADIRRQNVVNIDVAQLSKEFYLQIVDTDQKKRATLQLDPHGPDNNGFVSLYQRFAEIDRIALKNNDLSLIKLKVDNFLKEKDIKVAQDSQEYAFIARECLKSRKSAFEILAARADGNYDNPHDRVTGRLTSNESGNQPKISDEIILAVLGTGGLLSDLIKVFSDDMLAKGEWDNKTYGDNLNALNLFKEALGDKDVRKYSDADFTDFRKILEKMPTNRNKGKLKGKTITELLAMTKITKTMAPGTIDKRLCQISSLFGWALNKRHIVHNFTIGLRVSKKEMKRAERRPFEASDIQKITQELPASAKRPERFWIPLIGAFSAARLNETCQLYTDDIIMNDDIPRIRITDARLDQKLKNKSSKREVPIHPTLIKLGFLNYVKECQERKQERLWPALTLGKKVTAVVSQTGSGFLKTLLSTILQRFTTHFVMRWHRA